MTARHTAQTARTAVHRLVALDAGHGARAALPAVRRSLSALPGPGHTLRHGDSDELAALAELYEVAGWVLYDAGLPGPAGRANAWALRLAARCGDRWTARLVLLNSSMLLTDTGRPRAALDAVERAVSGPRPLPPRVAALALLRRAHAVALLGGERDAVTLSARARSSFLDGVSARDPYWAWWIDARELLGHQGWVRARLGHWDHALPQLHEAVGAAGPTPSYRQLFAAELLSATARAGAWTDAVRLAGDLADGLDATAAATGSARTVASLTSTALRLRDAHPHTNRHTHPRARRRPAVREAGVRLLESLTRAAP